MKSIDNSTTPATPSTEEKSQYGFLKSFNLPRCKGRIGFFSGWLLSGFIMMLLNRTIWPEIDTDLKGLYDLSTLWVKMVNEICLSAFPYFEKVGNWFTEAISSFYLWWSTEGFDWFKFLAEAVAVMMLFAFLLALIATGVYALKEAKNREFFKELFAFIKSKMPKAENPKNPENHKVGNIEIEDIEEISIDA